MNEKLEPCPFCGAKVSFDKKNGILGKHDKDCFFWVLKILPVLSEEKSDTEFIKAWNRRERTEE